MDRNLGAFGRHLVFKAARAFFAAAISRSNRCAFARKPLGNRSTNTARSARYECNPAVKTHRLPPEPGLFAALRRFPFRTLPEAAGDVVFGAAICRLREYFGRFAHFDQPADARFRPPA